MMRFLHFRRLVAVPATAATLALGLAAAVPQLSSPVSAQGSPTCASAVSTAPTGPVTVSVATKPPFGRVLVVGSGAFAGCSLYVLTSDQLHALTFGLASFACSDGPNVLSTPCDSVLWPALLTSGAPIAGPGVDRRLLGTATRSDVLGGQSVQQVTYAGQPLYRFFLDESPEQTDGANLFDPVTSPTGTWYLVNPSRGHPATGRAQLQVESVSGSKVLSASMDNDLDIPGDSLLTPPVSFPVYALNAKDDRGQACGGFCALIWSPVLTRGRPEAGPGVDRDALGVVVRPDGTHQVTYDGKPLYLFIQDAYIPGVVGTPSINGAGAVTPWGVFNTVPLS
jgi:predicted lipoprotein with Yx(FWY)xxD motif